jgi:hypothetical protein
MRAAIFIVLFLLVFACTTLTHRGGVLAFGWHSFTSYGWPQPWLRVHVTDQTTWINDKRVPGPRKTESKIDWQPFIVSAGTAAGIAAILSLPVFFWPAKKSERDCDHVA